MKHTEMKDLTPIKSNHKEVVAKVHESAEIKKNIFSETTCVIALRHGRNVPRITL
jgi:hypothetical protein